MRPPTFSGRIASQDAEELGAFMDLLVAEGVRSYGEIGAREGDTFHAVMCRLPKGSKGVALDLAGGPWGHERTAAKLRACVEDLRDRKYDVSMIFGDSRAAATIQQFHGRGPYDAILIDGDHRLPGVTADWNNYRKAAPLIAFHDIVGTGQHDRDGHRVEVPLLWESIKADGLRTQEFVAPESKMGIGVVWP